MLMQVSWESASLTHTFSSATEPYDSQGARRFHFNGPDLKITSKARLIALAMTLNELCTNTTKFGATSPSPTGRSGKSQWTIDELKQWLTLSGPKRRRSTAEIVQHANPAKLRKHPHDEVSGLGNCNNVQKRPLAY